MKQYNYSNYQNYINEQLAHKRTTDRTKYRDRSAYIEKIKSNFPNIKKVLCVGSRHVSEVISFRDAGYESIGIDLFSSDESIVRIVDMNSLEQHFSDNEFDFIFACHSFEHCFDPAKVLKSFFKISKFGAFIVLPLMKEPNSKDPCVFDFMTKLEHSPSKEEIENELKLVSQSNISLKDLVYRPSQYDGFWLSVQWNK